VTSAPSHTASGPSRSRSHREGGRRLLLEALERRDGAELKHQSQRWAHRHGVEALNGLIEELTAEGVDLREWWQQQLSNPTPTPFLPQKVEPAAAAATAVPSEADDDGDLWISADPWSSPATPNEAVTAAAQDTPTQPEKTVADARSEAESTGPGTIPEPSPAEPLPFAWATSVEPDWPELGSLTALSAEPIEASASGSAPDAAPQDAPDTAPHEPTAAAAEPPDPVLATAPPLFEPLPSFDVEAIFAMQAATAQQQTVQAGPPIVEPVQLDLAGGSAESVQTSQPADPPRPADPGASASPAPLPPPSTDASRSPRRNPLSRIKSLVRECIDEVAQTFQAEDDRDRTPPPEVQRTAPPPLALQQSASLQQPRPSRRQTSRRGKASTDRPVSAQAPAPSHPSLEALRAWLPDQPQEEERRAS
jgi:hypothetical protein